MGGIHAAFEATVALVHEVVRTGEWGRLAEPLTPQVAYRINGCHVAGGRDGVRAHFEVVGSTFPGTLIANQVITWHVVDDTTGRAVFEVRHELRDPGDGSQHHASTTCSMVYAGGGLWSHIEDTFNPDAYRAMYRGWLRHAQRCGDLGPDALRLLAELEQPSEQVLRPIDAGLRHPVGSSGSAP